MQRIQKLLSSYGCCSRRKAEELIKQKRVKINNRIAVIGDKAQPSDKLYVDNKLITKQKDTYIMFHKPVGCITALKDAKLKTVMDYIKIKERIFPVGRLDYNTSGLLLLTNNGDFANRIMHPRNEIKKTYLAELYTPVTPANLSALKSGILLKDGKTAPAEVKLHNPLLIEITIHEGKKRIVRRMLQFLGIKVKTLKRTAIGNLTLSSLKPAAYRHLTKEDMALLFS